MKKMKQATIFLLALILVGVSSVYGQKPIKPKLAKIESMLQSGDILGAKEMSDVAIVNEKLMTNAKTFYLHALVHVALDTTASLNGTVADATDIAITSFTKATEMAGDKGLFLLEGGFPVTMEQHWDSYFNFYFNRAAEYYQAEDYENSLADFEMAQKVRPDFVQSFEFAGWAAVQAGLYDKTKEYFYKVIEMSDSVSRDVYNNLAVILGSQDGDYEEGLNIIGQARNAYPGDNELARLEIDYLNKLGKIEEATNNLKMAIENEPSDAMLRFFLGILYEQLARDSANIDQKDELMKNAMDAYRGGIEVDPEHYECNYNVGVLMIEKANQYITERNNLGISKADRKREEQLVPLIQAELKNALPTWEKIMEIVSKKEASFAGVLSDPSASAEIKKDAEEFVSVLNTVKYLYMQLKMYDEAEAIIARVDATGASG